MVGLVVGLLNQNISDEKFFANLNFSVSPRLYHWNYIPAFFGWNMGDYHNACNRSINVPVSNMWVHIRYDRNDDRCCPPRKIIIVDLYCFHDSTLYFFMAANTKIVNYTAPRSIIYNY